MRLGFFPSIRIAPGVRVSRRGLSIGRGRVYANSRRISVRTPVGYLTARPNRRRSQTPPRVTE